MMPSRACAPACACAETAPAGAAAAYAPAPAHPGAGERDHVQDLNPQSKHVITAQLEPSLRDAQPGEQYQFERHGYFVADRVDSKPGAPVFNRAVTLRDSWHK